MDKQHQITAWVNDYIGQMISWAIKRTADPDLARDLVQETFLAALQNIESYEERSSPKTWLISILNNKIVDHFRKKVREASTDFNSLSNFFDEDGGWHKENQAIEWGASEDNLLDNEEFVMILEDCIENLPEKWRISIRLKYLSDKSGEVICQDLGITSSNYWQMIRRAKLSLRNCIDDNWK